MFEVKDLSKLLIQINAFNTLMNNFCIVTTEYINLNDRLRTTAELCYIKL